VRLPKAAVSIGAAILGITGASSAAAELLEGTYVSARIVVPQTFSAYAYFSSIARVYL